MTDITVATSELIAFLKTKRWFGDKAREIRNATFRDVLPVEWPNSAKPFAVARVDVTTDAGTSTYQLFIERGVERLADALDDVEFRRGLVEAFVQGMAFEARGVRWIFEAEGEESLVAPASASITRSSAEQSNSSLIIDGAAILKMFRRLEPGIHPDVEITHFLTIDRQFVNVPVLLGTIRFEDANGVTIAGMIQELVPDAVDGWTYALIASRAYFREKTGSAGPPFRDDAKQLGVVTRALHETLASGDAGSGFETRTVSPTQLREWTSRTVAMAERALATLAAAVASGKVPPEHLDDAEAVLKRRQVLTSMPTAAAGELADDAGSVARVHGDYHLGPVIRSATGRFLVIDFEGEPARPLEERRAPQSPLRDVAGMLRSFAYAAAVGSREGRAVDRAAAWELDARDAFLSGYFAEQNGRAGLLPRSPDSARRLIALFEIEKVFYELQYELDHRPDWVWIPLRAIARLSG